jgi:hypothetical protein
MQIKTQIKKEDGEKLDKILKDYGFISKYEFVKAVLTVFIKAYDPREDEILTENFRDIFTENVNTKIRKP